VCKGLSIVALMVAVVLVAALVPSTSQAFLGPVWTPFSIGSSSGCGYGGGYGGYGYAAYGGYGYYGSPYCCGGHHKHHRGARHGH
jgi:hypothetical protein